jgi:hypothetical protein
MNALKGCPVVTLNTNRKVGLELEYDSRSACWHAPSPLPAGWTEKFDGSLNTGREYVLARPLKFSSAVEKARAFSKAVRAAKTPVAKTGGFHVHVASGDLTTAQSIEVALFYNRFSSAVCELVAASRRAIHWAALISPDTTPAQLIHMYSLNRPATNRDDAKYSRHYHAVNLAMVRCSRAAQRSIEFRQQSVSKHWQNIVGWTGFCVAIVESVKLGIPSRTVYPATFDGLVAMLQDYERETGSRGVADWVVWRRRYLSATASAADCEAVKAALASVRGRHGLIWLATKCKLPYPVLLNAVSSLVRDRVITERAGRFKFLGETSTSPQ